MYEALYEFRSGGGGTDLPSYYRDHSGFLIAAAIDKYVYITLHQTFVEELIIKYSKLERVNSILMKLNILLFVKH